jgi:hypothetical protein
LETESIAMEAWSPRRVHALDPAQIDALAELLIDCVDGGRR